MIENPHLHASPNNNNNTTAKHIEAQEIQCIHEEIIKDDPKLETPDNQWLRSAWGWGSNTQERIFADTHNIIILGYMRIVCYVCFYCVTLTKPMSMTMIMAETIAFDG